MAAGKPWMLLLISLLVFLQIYSLVLTDRLWWSKQVPFGRMLTPPPSCLFQAEFSSIEALLSDSCAIQSWRTQRENLWSNSSLPTLETSYDVLVDIARSFDKVFDFVAQRETKHVVDNYFKESLSLHGSALTSFEQMDSSIGLIIVTIESIYSSICSWNRLLGERSSVTLNNTIHYNIPTTSISSSTIGQLILNRARPLSKSFILQTSILESSVDVITQWFKFSLERNDTENGSTWGAVGWNLSLFVEILKVGYRTRIPLHVSNIPRHCCGRAPLSLRISPM